MSDIKLFRYGNTVEKLKAGEAVVEKELQNVIERNMMEFFGVEFLASEYQIANGRLDSIGIDENHCPVIFEYKRSQNDNVINQGLFYLSWLMGHKAEFELLVLKKLGRVDSELIDWTMPRVICIAGDFNKYDEEAIKQINRNISLIRYKKFGNDLLMFEQLNAITNRRIESEAIIIDKPSFMGYKRGNRPCDKGFDVILNEASTEVKELYEDIRNYMLTLGDDVTENKLKLYTAFKKIKNFACVEIQKQKVIMRLNIDPTSVALEEGFMRDCHDIGHWGTGDLEISIRNRKDFEKSQVLIMKSYNEN